MYQRSNYGNYNSQQPSGNYDQIVSQTFNLQFTDQSYVEESEKVIKIFASEHFEVTKSVGRRLSKVKLTNSQLRHILAMTSSIYDEANNNGIEQVADRLAYLKVQLIYQSGRNLAVKAFVEVSSLIDLIDMVNGFQELKDLLRLCRYMEALVAYFKYYGGQD